MDERLLAYYNSELRYVREMAGEFAREFPKIAGRLALDRDAKEICPDPYVERLLEGCVSEGSEPRPLLLGDNSRVAFAPRGILPQWRRNLLGLRRRCRRSRCRFFRR